MDRAATAANPPILIALHNATARVSLCLFPCFLQIGTYELAEVGQLDFRPLALKQIAAELLLQALDGAREQGLRDLAMPRRLGEVRVLAKRK